MTSSASDTQQVPAVEAVVAVQERNSFWLERYSRLLITLDLVGLAVVGIVAVLVRLGGGATLQGQSYFAVAGALVAVWMLVLGMSRCYEARFLGSGPEEFRRVGNASV